MQTVHVRLARPLLLLQRGDADLLFTFNQVLNLIDVGATVGDLFDHEFLHSPDVCLAVFHLLVEEILEPLVKRIQSLLHRCLRRLVFFEAGLELALCCLKTLLQDATALF